MLVAFPSLIFAIITLLIYFTYKTKTEAKLDDLKMELLGESENKTSFEAKYNQALSELKRYEDLKKGKELDEIQLLFAKVNMLDDKITFLNSSFKNKLDTIISMVESIKLINEDNSSLIKNIIIDNSDNDDEEDLKNNIDNSFNHIADQEKPKNNEEKEEQNISNTVIKDNNTTNDLKEENKVENNNSNVANNINENNRIAPIFANGYVNDFKKNDYEVDVNKIFSSKKDDDIFDDPSYYSDAFLEEYDNKDKETEKAYDFNDVFEQEQEKEHKEAETEVETKVESNDTENTIGNSTDNENMGDLVNNENSGNTISSEDNNEENVDNHIISDITADSSLIKNEINDVNELDNHGEAIMNNVKEKTVNVENMSVKPDTNISGGNVDDDCKNMEIDNFIVNAQGTPFDNPKSCDIDILNENKETDEQQEISDNLQTTAITEQQEISDNSQTTAITEQKETNSTKTTENTLNNDIDEEVKQVVDMQNSEKEYEEDLKAEPNEELVKEDEIKEIDNQEEDEEDKEDENENNNEGIYNDFPPAPDYVENNDNNLNSDNQKKQPTISISNNGGFDIKESIEKLKAQLNESSE